MKRDMQNKIVGRNSVLALLQNPDSNVEQVLIAKETNHNRLRHIQAVARRKKIRVNHVPRRELDQIASEIPHQGVIAITQPTHYATLNEILNQTKDPKLLIMLDEVQDPRNLGAIIRTANAVNANGVIIPEKRSASLTVAAHIASAGSAENIPIARVTNLVRTIQHLKDDGYWIIGTNQEAATTYTQADFFSPICLVFGSEQKGIRGLVRENCDLIVSIPMLGEVPSLNVSVAAGVLMYEVIRQRSGN